MFPTKSNPSDGYPLPEKPDGEYICFASCSSLSETLSTLNSRTLYIYIYIRLVEIKMCLPNTISDTRISIVGTRHNN